MDEIIFGKMMEIFITAKIAASITIEYYGKPSIKPKKGIEMMGIQILVE